MAMNGLLAWLSGWLDPAVFSPHGFCLWWEPGLIWLHAGSDLATALAYFSIPVAMLVLVRRRPDWRFPGLAILFATFIMLCGLTHLIGLATLWYPVYWLEGAVKLATAVASVLTAILLWPLIPRALTIPSAAALQEANQRLAQEVTAKDQLLADLQRREDELRRMAEELERRVAERTERLADANRHFTRQLAELPAIVYGGLVHADGQFELRSVSESFTRITGWRMAIFNQGLDWRFLLDPLDAERRDDFLRDAAQAGQTSTEYSLRRADGSRIWVRDHVGVVASLPDGAVEIIGYVADITIERDVQAKAEAGGRLAVLGEMATGLAHELNQPLAIMLLASDNARRALEARGEGAVASAIQRLDRIGEQAKRARGIVDHLRIFGRSEEGAVGPVRLAEAVEGALVLTAGAIRDAGIELAAELPADLPPVMARLVPLEQTIVNLLVNARDAIRGRGVQDGRITLRGAVEGAGVTLTFADTGGGIPDSVIDRIFEPFFTTKAVGKGTGLGLSIAHSTMRSFGGAITAENGEEGAIFVLRFASAAPAPASG
jgi:PAS domain S-box-containing protein